MTPQHNKQQEFDLRVRYGNYWKKTGNVATKQQFASLAIGARTSCFESFARLFGGAAQCLPATRRTRLRPHRIQVRRHGSAAGGLKREQEAFDRREGVKVLRFCRQELHASGLVGRP